MPHDGETLDVAVTLNGETQLTKYRVETVRWDTGTTSDERFNQLQSFIRDYDDEWELVQIGAPGRDIVPITFRKREDASSADASREPEAGPEAA